MTYNNALSELRNHSIDMSADVNQKHFDLIKWDKGTRYCAKMDAESVHAKYKKGIFKTHPNLETSSRVIR